MLPYILLMCFRTYCCCVPIAVVIERHVERCGPAVGSTGDSDKAYICTSSKIAGYGRSINARVYACVCGMYIM